MKLMPLMFMTVILSTAALQAAPRKPTSKLTVKRAESCNDALKTSSDFPRQMSEWVIGAQTPNYYSSSIHEMRRNLDAALKKILRLKSKERTFENTVLAADAALDRYKSQGLSLTSINALLVSSEEGAAEFKGFSEDYAEGETNFFTNFKLYEAIKETNVAPGAEEGLRWSLMESMEKEGATLAPEVRERISALAKDGASLEADYSRSIRNDKTRVEFAGSEIVGLSPEWLAKMSEEGCLVDGVLSLPVGDPGLITAFIKQANQEAARSKAFIAYRSRVPENLERLFKMTKINYETAKLLQKDSQLDIAVEKKSLAGTPEIVAALLEQLAKGFKPAMAHRLDQLREMKKAEGLSTPLSMSDAYYYENKLQGIDEARKLEVQKYFNAGKFNENFFRVLGEMFEISLTEVTDQPVWHPSVKLFKLTDLKSSKDIGYMYFDNFGRPGKDASTAFVEEMISRRQISSGKERLPVVLYVTNWGPYENRDTLNISVYDVLTALHEMGHALHATFQRAPHFAVSGFSLPTDMMEVPSTTLELMGKRAEMLVALSAYEGDPTKKMPLALAEEVAKSLRGFSLLSGDFHSGSHEFNTVFLSMFDQAVQLAAPNLKSGDAILNLYRQMYRAFFQMEPDPGDQFPQTFHHIAGPYAGYYGAYIVARIGAANNVVHLDKRGGIMNPRALREWRTDVLEIPAYQRSSSQVQRDYLGHEINTAPIFDELNFPRE